MPDDPRIQELLDEMIDREATPEEVCGACAHLLPVVTQRWRQICQARAELDALLPVSPHGNLPTMPPEQLSLPQISGYEIEAVLGRGGMGVVFRARHLRLNRRVALKMGLDGSFSTLHDRERFQREAEAVATLRHSNIVQIYDVGDANGRPYFTMEYLEGGSLTWKLAGTPQPARQAASLLATLAGAMHAAHQGGIVHRDLKPANILFAGDGTPKITDFGLARRLEGGSGLTLSGVPLGTPSYMAPEQARGHSRAVGPAVDVYSLGAILYELLTGRPPFRAESAAETVHQLFTQDPVSPSRLNGKVPRNLETICLKCLSKEPRLRYPSAEALNDDLNRFLRGDAISARPEGRMRRSIRAVRRRPALAVGISAGALCAALILAGGSWLLFDRAVVAQAVTSDLLEIDGLLQKSSFPEAKAAIERAQGRLGTRESPALRQRLNLRMREWKLADRLEQVYLDSVTTRNGGLRLPQADGSFDEAFREFGVGQNGDDPETVAAQVRKSNIRVTLLAALDRWSVVAQTQSRANWTVEVAARAEPEPTPWRKDARNTELRQNRTALRSLIEHANVEDESVALLLALSSLLAAVNEPQREKIGLQLVEKTLVEDNEFQTSFLTRIQRAHPNDLWTNFYLGTALMNRNKPDEAVRYYQTVIALRPRLLIGYHHLGQVLNLMANSGSPERFDEAIMQLRKALEMDPNSAETHAILINALGRAGRLDEGIAQARIASRLKNMGPKAARIHGDLGVFLYLKGRVEESIPELRLSLSLEPENTNNQNAYRAALRETQRWEELRIAWAKTLEADRPNHEDWYGYAELCLYLGREDEYCRARHALLARFGTSDSPQIAERTARACLLLPASGEEMSRAVLLADLAARADPKKYAVVYKYFQFVKGLAEYRQGNFNRAIAVMRGEASKMRGPLPQLVLSMALYRIGKQAEARQTLASAMFRYDWREKQVINLDDWIQHVLRREAERMIVPDLTAILEGKQEPRDNDERLAQIGVCRFENRFAALARVYAEAFAADPKLAMTNRGSAARVAVQAGYGRGIDAGSLGEAERRKWRDQARTWLRDELSLAIGALDRNFELERAGVRQALTNWQNEPELAGIRESAELEKLPADEQADCRKLWAAVNVVLEKTSKPK